MAQRTLGLVLAGIISGAAIAAMALAPPGSRPLTGAQQTTSTETGKASVGGPFTLTDQGGKRVTDKDYAGKYLVVFFGFTNCPDICPSGLQVMSVALDKLGTKADAVQPLFITFDPTRDTPEKLAAYLKSFSPRITGLTGSEPELQGVVKAYRVYVQKVEAEHPDGPYSFDHTALFYIMGKNGEFMTHVPQTNNVDELVSALEKVLK